MFLGIVIAGLGIGALLGAFQQRSQAGPPLGQTTPAPVITPVAQERGPVAIATLEPPHTEPPADESSPVPSPSQSSAPPRTAAPVTAAPTAAPAALESATPSSATTPVSPPTPVPAAAATATPVPAPSRTPAATPSIRPTLRPSPTPSAVPAPTAKPATAPPIVGGQPLQITGSAPKVVQRYIDALVRGDEASAYAALGGAPGDAGLTLSEEAFIDPNARVASLKTTPVSPMEAQVDAEITSGRGTYVATYRVRFGPKGPYIVSHDYIKV
jgi:hypothetical protein